MKECHGKMFPEISELLLTNHTASGKVFQARLSSIGPFQREPVLEMQAGAWEDCQQCPQYRSCYDLSMARMTLEQTIYRI